MDLQEVILACTIDVEFSLMNQITRVSPLADLSLLNCVILPMQQDGSVIRLYMFGDKLLVSTQIWVSLKDNPRWIIREHSIS